MSSSKQSGSGVFSFDAAAEGRGTSVKHEASNGNRVSTTSLGRLTTAQITVTTPNNFLPLWTFHGFTGAVTSSVHRDLGASDHRPDN